MSKPHDLSRYDLNHISDLWIAAERTHDPTALFEALEPFVQDCFASYFTPDYLRYLQRYALHPDEYEDYLQEFWIRIFRQWENVVPLQALIYQTINYWAREYRRTTTNYVLRRAKKVRRDWTIHFEKD